MQRVIENTGDIQALASLLRHRELPCTVTVAKGRPRSTKQNRLQRQWINEAAEQLGDESAEEKRGYCKLVFGVPILRAEDEEFREAYDTHVKGLPYESKLACMMEPIDFPVTRRMKTAQKKQYLDRMWDHFTGLGVRLTDPDSIPDDQ